MATITLPRADPIRNFKFNVNILHVANGLSLANMGFMAISGLQVTTEMIPYREGGFNTTTRKMPGQSDFPPVTFTRGVFAGQPHQWEWFKQIFFFMSGTGQKAQQPDFRTNIVVRVLPHPTAGTSHNYATGGGAALDWSHNAGFGVQAYKIFNAWPVSWGHSDLDAGGNGIVMEQLTVVHEGLIALPAKNTPNGLVVPASDENIV